MRHHVSWQIATQPPAYPKHRVPTAVKGVGKRAPFDEVACTAPSGHAGYTCTREPASRAMGTVGLFLAARWLSLDAIRPAYAANGFSRGLCHATVLSSICRPSSNMPRTPRVSTYLTNVKHDLYIHPHP
jgi:hypothetical protein